MSTDPALPPDDTAPDADYSAPTSRVLPYSPKAVAVLASRVNLVESDLDGGARFNANVSVTAGKRAKGEPAPYMPRGIAYFFANGYALVAGLLATIRERDATIAALSAPPATPAQDNDMPRDAHHLLSFIGYEVPADADLLRAQTGFTRVQLRAALAMLVTLNLITVDPTVGALRVPR